MRIRKSSFDAESLAKPEMSDITPMWTNNSDVTLDHAHNPDHSICLWIQIRIHYGSESRFGQIEYGLIHTEGLSK